MKHTVTFYTCIGGKLRLNPFSGLGDRLHRDLGKKIMADPEAKNHPLGRSIQVIPTSSYR